MEAETRMATPRQLAYIERLGTDTGATIAKPIGELTMMEASELIAELLQKANVEEDPKNRTSGRSLHFT